MSRKPRPAKERARLFELRAGVCYLCNGKILVGDAWEIEHRIPFAISGDDTDGNLELAHVKCHRDKTSVDAGVIAKTKRQSDKHRGIRPTSGRPLAGTKASGWRKRLNGTVERW